MTFSSTTKRILMLDNLFQELEKDYYLVVLDYDLNRNEKVQKSDSAAGGQD